VRLGWRAAVFVGLLAGLAASSLYSYLLFHSLAELFAIVIAGATFVVAWNARRFLARSFLLFVGSSYLAVAAVDLAHTLTYRGMGVFPTDDANIPTQLWLAARYVQSLSLLAAPLFFRWPLRPAVAVGGFAGLAALLIVLVARGGFPTAFVQGEGLTTFKTASEYAISLVLVGAAAHLFVHRRRTDPTILRLLLSSIALTVASELAFTLYTDPYGVANLVGHLLKVVAFYLVYHALVVVGLRQPFDLLFRELKQSEQRYRALFTHLVDGFAYHEIVHDESGRPVDYVFCEVNEAFERLTGLRHDDVVGRRATEVLPGLAADPVDWVGLYGRVAATGEPVRLEQYSQPLRRWYSVAAYSPRPCAFVTIFADVTARRQAEDAVRQSEERLRAALRAGSTFAFEWDPASDRLLRTEESAEILGLPVPEAREETGAGLAARIRPDDRERLRETVTGLGPERPEYRITYCAVRPDGSEVWLDESGRAAFDAEGRLARIVGMTTDVTRRELAEQALRRLNAELDQRVLDRTAQIRALALALTEAEARERARVAALLHDHHQQLLAGAKMMASSLRRSLEDRPVALRSTDSLVELLDQALQSSRSLSHELSPPVLRRRGLAAGLEWLAGEMAQRHGLQVTVRCDAVPDTVPQAVQTWLFQAARELLFNVVKHAGVSAAEVTLAAADG